MNLDLANVKCLSTFFGFGGYENVEYIVGDFWRICVDKSYISVSSKK